MKSTFSAFVPGRVNLIGEHTDYNLGFVLPTVIPQTCKVTVCPSDGRIVTAQSQNIPDDPATYRLGEETPPPSGAQRHWWHYVQGVTWVLAQEHRLAGMEITVRSDVPLGSGLSSSASLTVALLRALGQMFQIRLEDLPLAHLARRVENEFIGAPVGILDPLACHLGRSGEALFIDTENLEIKRVALPAQAELIVIHSGLSHQHAGGDYATRVAECQAACRELNVPHLRACQVADLERIARLPSPLAQRARHVVTENQRVLDAVQAMETDDLDRLGELFDGSHTSQRDDYGVSVPAVDQLVHIAQQHPSIYGARLTGGGFGGSIVALARLGQGQNAAQDITRQYLEQTGHRPSLLVPRC
jgi:galactokinase